MAHVPNADELYRAFAPINPHTGTCTPKQLHDTLQKYLQQNGASFPHPLREHYCLLQQILRHWKVSKTFEAELLKLYLNLY